MTEGLSVIGKVLRLGNCSRHRRVSGLFVGQHDV